MSNLIQNQNIQTDDYTVQENLTWQELYTRQLNNLQDKADDIFLKNIKNFDLPEDKIPNLNDVSDKLSAVTGWKVSPVKGLISYEPYFKLLSNKLFPSATFIRSAEEAGLSKDPDIFHEIFGHCTMLLSNDYADFMQKFAQFALTVEIHDRPLFSRLIWFTTETGLINTDKGLKVYGSTILSSYTESNHCFSQECILKPFNIVDIFREPYRADILQKVYYVIDDISQVYSLLDDTDSLYEMLSIARKKGEFTPLFPIVHDKYSSIGHCVPL